MIRDDSSLRWALEQSDAVITEGFSPTYGAPIRARTNDLASSDTWDMQLRERAIALLKRADPHCDPDESYSQFRLFMLLEERCYPLEQGLVSLDDLVRECALDRNMDVRSLEIGEDFLQIEASMPLRCQEALLRAVVEDLENPLDTSKHDEALVDAYVSGVEGAVIEWVERVAEDSEEANACYYAWLLEARNERMAARIVDIARYTERRFLFMIGLYHLIGPNSILEILKQHGATIERIEAVD